MVMFQTKRRQELADGSPPARGITVLLGTLARTLERVPRATKREKAEQEPKDGWTKGTVPYAGSDALND